MICLTPALCWPVAGHHGGAGLQVQHVLGDPQPQHRPFHPRLLPRRGEDRVETCLGFTFLCVPSNEIANESDSLQTHAAARICVKLHALRAACWRRSAADTEHSGQWKSPRRCGTALLVMCARSAPGLLGCSLDTAAPTVNPVQLRLGNVSMVLPQACWTWFLKNSGAKVNRGLVSIAGNSRAGCALSSSRYPI